MKAVSLMRMGDLETDLTERFPNVDFVFTTGVSSINTQDKQNLDILFGYDSDLDAAFLSDCPNLKWLAWYSTGVNNLPLKFIDENNIKEDMVIVQGNAFQVFWYWGSVEEYVKFLNDEMKNARNSIINIYLLYLANKEDLEDCQPDDMNDISMEYLNKIGSGIVCDEVGENSLDNLTVKEIKELNKYLEATGFDKIVF